MDKLYLISYSVGYDEKSLKDFLNGSNYISFWFINLPYSIFVKTSLTSRELYELIAKKFGEDQSSRMIVIEVTHNHWGRLPTDHWKYFAGV